MRLNIDGHSFLYEVENIVRLFYPGEKLDLTPENADISTIMKQDCENVYLKAVAFGKVAEKTFTQGLGEQEYEFALCTLLFRLLCEKTGIKPPWGILTGVRPVRLVHPLFEAGLTDDEIVEHFLEKYQTESAKARLAVQTAREEQIILAENDYSTFSLYIGIPFCPTRCLYCSFVSQAVQQANKLMPEFTELLKRELEQLAEIVRECGLRLQTVYIGGGTPTTISAAQLAEIMRTVQDSFDLSNLCEYTVEAGRPDTLLGDEGREKLAVIKALGADRVSINPQTMNDEVLSKIGRAHTAAQTLDAYKLAREAGFAIINMDTIAGLPGDSPESFMNTMKQVIALEPENVTVHTLTIKRSSDLRDEPNAFEQGGCNISALLDEGREQLFAAGYSPYYLYRQKGTRQNLENVGYTKPGFASRYNVYIMEEVHTILAAGAGGVTKLCLPPNEIKRVFNFKYPHEYISRFDEIAARKAAVRSFYERYKR